MLRNFFRGTAAHNTLAGGRRWSRLPIEPERLFALPEDARARVEVFQPGAQLDRLTVRHDGYRALPSPVGIERTFYLDKRERALAVTDRLIGTGAHEVVGRLHLPDDQARLRAASTEEQARALRVPDAPRTFEPLRCGAGARGLAARACVLFAVGADAPVGRRPGTRRATGGEAGDGGDLRGAASCPRRGCGGSSSFL